MKYTTINKSWKKSCIISLMYNYINPQENHPDITQLKNRDIVIQSQFFLVRAYLFVLT